MGLTRFPNGVSSFGIPQFGGAGLYPASGLSNHWWVRGVSTGDGVIGSDGNPGDDPTRPFLTMARAFAFLGSGDVIHVTGNIREQIDTPVGIFDITVVGEGTRPRLANAHTGNNGYSTATWKAPASPVATTPLLRVRQQGWRFVNMLFAPPTDSAGLRAFRDAGTGNAERDGSHMSCYGCRFDGGQDGIEAFGRPDYLYIESCFFRGQTAKSIKDTVGAGVGTNLSWYILYNRFVDNASHIVAPTSQGVITDNVFSKHTTMSVDLVGGAGNNIVTKNYLSGTYSVAGGYRVANANDEWAGNFNTLTGGITVADPA